jgi:glyoxylase-like metal-dependent hydrolase (beta-lactamase superfamily II)
MRLTDRVYLVGGSGYGLSPTGDCNIFLIDGKTEMALVDTGGGDGVEAILENVKEIGLNPDNIKYAFNTHCHFDHIGGNKELKEKTGCKIVAHPNDKKSIENLDELSLFSMAKEKGLRFKATSVDVVVVDGEKFKVGDLELEIIHTPGHTPGCFSLLLKEGKLTSIFTGDIAGAQGRLGYINGPGFSLPDWKMSIKKLIKFKPDRLYPGHNTFLMNNATEHLQIYDQKLNAAWTTIVTEVG